VKEKFQRFMVGRYGADELSRFMIIVAFVLVVLSIFIRSGLFSWVPLILLVLIYVRMFSKNVQKRYAENQKFLELKGRVTGLFHGQKKRLEQSKDYHIYKCPKCKQKIRIPRGKGKISITCPKCGDQFIKKS